jgi:hypothetical protein
MHRTGRRRPEIPRRVFLLILMSVGFGVIAALLASPWPPSGGPAPPAGSSGPPQVPGLLITQLVAIAVFLLIASYFVYRAYLRFTEGAMQFPVRVVLTAIVTLLVASAFVAVAHLLSGGFGPLTHPPAATNNSSSIPTQSMNLSPNQNPPGGGGSVGIPGLPGVTWLTLGIAVLVASVALAAFLLLAGRMSDREEDDPGATARVALQLRSELLESLQRLGDDPTGDPRDVIRALYHRLLLTLAPRLGPLSELTAREIEKVILEMFAVHRNHARDLTALFEEARYSSHSLGAIEVDRARNALSGILGDLSEWLDSRGRTPFASSSAAGASGPLRIIPPPTGPGESKVR